MTTGMMILDDWYEDPDKWELQPWVGYDVEGSTVWVVRRCPACGRYIKEGKLQTNFEGQVRCAGWRCKSHGEVEPFWLYDD